MTEKLRRLAVDAGLIKQPDPVERRHRLSPQRREALRRSIPGLIRAGKVAQAEGLRQKINEAEYQARLRKARRINARSASK